MTPLMPKGRYTIMKQYMPRVGTRGLDMMYRTATVQVNLDYASERDMVRKYRVSLALQPVVSALFANSPFVEGLPSGLKSARCWVWLDTDADRCGIPSFVFDESMSYERYVDYALGVPMYFVYRDGKYIDVAGSSFNSFLQGALPQLPGQLPTMADWIDHTSTLFPDVRLKQYLEMRGADSGGRQHLCALPALWTGLLYDSTSLDQSIALIEQFTLEDIENARTIVPTEGLQARLGGVRVLDVARDVLEIAQAGLRRRRCLNAEGLDESIFLRGLQLSVATGMSPADVMMEKFENGWNRDATMALFHEAL
jgi:glutamate--cysteine ligase